MTTVVREATMDDFVVEISDGGVQKSFQSIKMYYKNYKTLRNVVNY